ncbi:uncharacterized protein [Diadema antillarum]|uniref:uncharacterized protein n=1 Tax=Diadema antillarum TaxID=105358 RepID=UPI003A853B45
MLQNFEHDVTVESVMNAPDKKKKAEDVHDLYAERTDKDKRNSKKPEREGEETSDGRKGRENTREGAGTENQSTGGNKDVSVTEDGSEESAWETDGKKKVEHTRGHRGNQKNGQRTRGGRGGENLRGSPHRGSPKRRGQNRDRTHDMGKQPEKVARLPVETRSDSPNNAQRVGDSPKRYGMKRNNQSSPGPEADRHQQGRQARVRSSPRKGTKVGGKNAEQSPKLEKRNVSQISQGERGFPADKSGREREALSQFEEAVEFLANTESIDDPMTRLVADIRANSMDAGTVSAREAAWTDDNPWQIFPSHPSQKSVQYSKRSQGRRRETAITKTSSNITHSSQPAEANPPMNVEDIEQESCDRVSETGRSQQNVSEEIKSGKTGGVEEKTLPLTDWSDGEINGDFYLNEWEIDHSKPRPARKVDQRNKQRKTDSNSVHQDTSPIETTKLDDINQPPDRLAEEEFSSEIGTCDASLQEERTDQFGAQKALNDFPADLGAPNGESSDKATSSQVHQSARCTTPSQSRPFRRSSSGGKSSRRIAAVFTSPAEVPKVDWSINDPSKSIPKPTFPVSRQKSLDQEKDVKTAGTMTDARDFVILHNIVSGSSSVSDLPTGYSIKSVTITPQDKPDTEFLLEGNDGSASAPPSSPSSSPIPHSLKLDKSCMTEEIEDVDTSEEDKVAMMKVCFPDASPSDLESILDTCKGDVQWATNILLDSYGSANISPAMGGLVVEAASDVGSESVCTNIPLTSQDISSDRTKCAAQHDISENDKRLGEVNEGEGSEVEETGTDEVEQSHKSDSESLPSSAHGRVDNSDGNREGVEQVTGDNLGIETNNRFSDDDHVGGGTGDKECSQNRSEHDLTAPKIVTVSAEEHAELTLGKEEQSGEVTRTENAKESEEQNEDDEGESSSSEEFSNNFATGVTETSCSKTSTRCDSEVICSETSTSHDTGTISSQTSTSCDNEAIHSKTLTACDAEVICSKTPSSYVTETICSKIASNSETAEDDMPKLESSVDAQMMRNKLAALSDKSGIGGVGYLVKIADTCNQASLGTGSVVSQSSNAAVVCEDGVSRRDEKEDSNTRRDEVGTSNEQTCQDLPEGNDKNEAPKTTHEGIPGEIVISDKSTESSSTPPGRGEEDAVQNGATSESLTRMTDAHLSSCVRPFDEIEKVTRQGDTLPVVVENRRDLSDSLCTPDFDSAGGINASELREGQSNTSDVCSGLFSTVSGIESMVREVSDSDIPWKEEYKSPGEKTPKDDGKGKDTLQDPQEESGRSVYDYFGGMVLQMDAAFALQLQELFGPVGFHMQPDALSDDDLKVSIDYTTAKKLHAALSQGLKERFQSQETHLEDMLKRDEELARRLQQEENLKKLVKSHKNKTGKAGAPWSPKTRKKKEVAGIGGVTGRGMGQMGEGELTGRIQPPPVQRTVVPELAKIMAEEEEKERAEKQEVWSNGNQERGSSIATKLKREQLYEAYPDVDKSVLEEIFKANSYDLRHTKWEVNAVYREPAEPVKNVYSPGALERMQRRRQNSPARQKVDGDDSSDGQFQSREQPDYDDYRAEASLHYRQRNECFKKAAKAYHSGQKELALHYSTQGRLHSMQLKEANVRAAALIVQQRRQETGEDKLDLHNLHLEEALQVLQEVLMEKEQQWGRRRVDHGSPSQNRYLEVVTGRGKHSHGGMAKLRPAVETFLQQRGYRFSVTNAGCFRVFLQ